MAIFFLLPIFPHMKNFHIAANARAEILFVIRNTAEELRTYVGPNRFGTRELIHKR